MAEQCDVCERPWAVKFEWDYTSPERYCLEHILEPIGGGLRPDQTLLDFMPDCQQITHRLTGDIGDPTWTGREVRYRSLADLYVVLTGRLIG